MLPCSLFRRAKVTLLPLSGAASSGPASAGLLFGRHRLVNLPHPHSDGRFALAQRATDLVLIYPAKDRQKEPPSGFVALAAHTGDHVPPMLTGSASDFARWQSPKRCPRMARIH